MGLEMGNRKDGGFTMIEMLAVAAIMWILLAFGFVEVVRGSRLLKVTEMDNMAREIYLAAENRAALLSRSERLEGFVKAVGGELESDKRYYVKSDMISGDLLPTGLIDPALRDGCFYIVYDVKDGCVTDVFYAETDAGFTGLSADGGAFRYYGAASDSDVKGFYENWKKAENPAGGATADEIDKITRARRAKDRVYMGHYSGSATLPERPDIKKVELEDPVIDIVNGEELVLTVTYKSTYTEEGFVATALTTTLTYGGVTKILPIDTGAAGNVADHSTKVGYKVATWTLDTLDAQEPYKKQFKNWFVGEPSAAAFGGNFTVDAVLHMDDKTVGTATVYKFADGVADSKSNNSLFGKDSGDGNKAYIYNLRHLQNLDKTFSGVAGKTEAHQKKDIEEANLLRRNDGSHIKQDPSGGNEIGNWKKWEFRPISNGELTLYKSYRKAPGEYYFIGNLEVTSGSMTYDGGTKPGAGLFAEAGKAAAGGDSAVPFVFENVRMINVSIDSGTVPAGALAGTAVGPGVTFTNCRTSTAAGGTIEVKGTDTGGLLGTTDGAAAFINCAVGSNEAGEILGTIEGSGDVGGLAGHVGKLDDVNTAPGTPYTLSGYTVGAAVVKDASGNVVTDAQYAVVKSTGTGKNVGGLFGSIGGTSKIADCTVKGLIATGPDGNAGGLVGKAENTDITNCKAYWEKDKDGKYKMLIDGGNINYVITGKNAGGLVGELNSGTGIASTIRTSLAATTVDGSSAAGGLVGSVSGSVNIEKSYADCYLKSAAAAGGLVGSGDVYGLKNCYAAGFSQAEAGKTAGLVKGRVVTAQNCYSVVRVGVGKDVDLAEPDTKLYTDFDSSTGATVRYLSRPSNLTGSSPLGNAFEYVTETSTTHTYKLRNELNPEGVAAMTDYYPFLRLVGMDHYGDWAMLVTPQIPAGLAYYEMYQKSGATARYGVRGYGNDGTEIKQLKSDGGAVDLEVEENIIKDGYALVFGNGTELNLTDGYMVTYGGQVWDLNKTDTSVNSASVRVDTVTKWTWKKGDYSTEVVPIGITIGANEYTLIPLPDQIVTGALSDTGKFYQALTAVATYYFNPHFAKTVKADSPAEPGSDIGSPISVRTPRHLYDMSRFQDAGESLVYAGKNYYFSQELNLNYSAYTEGYTGIFKPGEGVPFTQDPIGKGVGGGSFQGTYDGGGKTITGVQYRVGTGSYFGLFGCAEGTLKNIKYLVGWETENLGSTSAGAYVGRLAGKVATVTDCTVAVSGGMDTTLAGNAGAYVGTLAGSAGTVTDCNVTVNKGINTTLAENTGADAYVGTLAGSAGTVTDCTVTVNEGINTRLAGNAGAYVGTLAGSADTVTRCTVTVVSGGIGTTLAENTGAYVGMLAGSANTVAHCTVTVDGDINTGLAENIGADAYVGALAGKADTATGCTVTVNGDISTTLEGNTGADAYVGALAGKANMVTGCTAGVSGALSVTGFGRSIFAGGLTGYVKKIEQSTATIGKNLTVTGTGTGTSAYGGGLTGYAYTSIGSSTEASKGCKATVNGDISVRGTGQDAYGGGLVGRADNESNNVNLSYCSATLRSLSVTGTTYTYGGGLAGLAGSINGCRAEIKEIGMAPTAEEAKPMAGSVTVTGMGESGDINTYGGGLAGRVYHTVTECSVNVYSVNVAGKGTIIYGGGLVGYAGSDSTVVDANVAGCTAVNVNSLSVTGEGTKTFTYGGGLAGGLAWGADNCKVEVTGEIVVKGTGDDVYGGGLVGRANADNDLATSVTNCTADIVSLSVEGKGPYTYGGGLVGETDNITNCTSNARGAITVTATGGSASAYGGGLAGGASSITRGEAATTSLIVTGMGDKAKDYAYGGGLVGRAWGIIKDCFSKTGELRVTGEGEYAYGGGLAGFASSVDNSTNGETVNAKTTILRVMGNGFGTSTYGGGLVGGTDWGITYGTARTGTMTVEGKGPSTFGGGLAGYTGAGTSSASVVDVSLTVQGDHETYGGGLAGWAYGTLTGCGADTASLIVKGSDCREEEEAVYAGGLVGCLKIPKDTTFTCTLDASYAVGRISDCNRLDYAGGLVGYSAGKVERCYAAVDVASVKTVRDGYRGGAIGYTDEDAGGSIPNNVESDDDVYWLKGKFKYRGVEYTMDGIGLNDSERGTYPSYWVLGLVYADWTFTGISEEEGDGYKEYQNKFLYHTGVHDKDWKYIHYGLWPIKQEIAVP